MPTHAMQTILCCLQSGVANVSQATGKYSTTHRNSETCPANRLIVNFLGQPVAAHAHFKPSKRSDLQMCHTCSNISSKFPLNLTATSTFHSQEVFNGCHAMPLSLSSTQLLSPFRGHRSEAGPSEIGLGSGERGLGYRKWRRGNLTVCGMEGSRSLLQESGNKRRAARKVASVVQRVERAQEEMERRAMRRKATRLYPQALLESLNERIRQNSWESALKVFELVRAQEWYTPEIGTYIKLMGMLGQCKKSDLAGALLEQLQDDKLRPTTQIFTAVLSVHMKCNELDRARAVFGKMREFAGCEPDVYTFTAMIKGCCDAGLYDRASQLFDEMKWAGVEPNIVTYNTLLHAYGKAGLFDLLDNFLTIMESKNVLPDLWTWNALIRSFGNHGRIAEMEHAYDGLLGQGLLPDIITLNTLVSAYGKEGLFGKMQCVLDYMRRYKYKMNTATFNSVIDVYGKAGLIEQMELMFSRMKAQGVRPNQVTFSSLLSAYGKQGIWHKIDKIMRQVRHSEVVPDAAVYNAAIDAYQRAQDFEGMDELYEEMKLRGCVPDNVTYTILTETYRRIGMLSKMEQLILEWQSSEGVNGSERG